MQVADQLRKQLNCAERHPNDRRRTDEWRNAPARRLQKINDHAMGVAYDFYANEVAQVLPYPKPEQFKDAVDALSPTNAKIADLDVSKMLDPSFVENAADRGLGQ